MKSKPSNFVILDVGSNKLAGIFTNFDKKFDISVSNQTLQYSSGFKSSMITDFKEAEETILRTIYALEQASSKSFKEVSVVISGAYTKSFYINCQSKLGNYPISNTDIKKIIDKALLEFKFPDQEIIAYFPIEFSIDENNFVKNPIGMIGKELRCQLHIIAASSNLVLNLYNCFSQCHMQIASFSLAIYSSGIACLSEDDKNLGSIIVDMGAQTTSFGIFWLGQFIYSGFVNLGGDHITSDIAKVFSISMKSAEKLKILYGGAITSSFEKHKSINMEEIDLKDFENLSSGILIDKLNAVIAARLSEILKKVKTQIEHTNLEHFIAKRLIVTGGGSSLKGLKEFMSKIFDKQVRLANPMLISGFKEDHNPPAYSAIIGTAINYAAKLERDYEVNKIGNNSDNWLSKTIKWAKENI